MNHKKAKTSVKCHPYASLGISFMSCVDVVVFVAPSRMSNRQEIIILKLVLTAVWVTVFVIMLIFAYHFPIKNCAQLGLHSGSGKCDECRNKQGSQINLCCVKDVILTWVCTKQSCFLVLENNLGALMMVCWNTSSVAKKKNIGSCGLVNTVNQKFSDIFTSCFVVHIPPQMLVCK